MKKFTLHIAFFILSVFIFQSTSQAQSAPCGDCVGFVDASADFTNVCAGDPVTLTAIGDGYAYANDFNTSTIGAGWSTNVVPQFNNPCGTGTDGTPHLWMGTSTAFPRVLETVDFNMTGGGNISFDFDMAIQGQAAPCEGPDLASEGVYLDFSTDAGVTWTTIFYFDPTPLNGPYINWANYSFPIPPEAQTLCTRFRWFQGGTSGNNFDHWGLDNIIIGPQLPPGSVELFWEGTLQNALPTEVIYPQNDTMLILVMQTPIDTCKDTIFITVSEPPTAILSFTPVPACAGEPINFIASGSTGTIGTVNYDLDNNGTYEYAIAAPGDTTFDILIPGVYDIGIQVVAPGGCNSDSVFQLTVSPLPTLQLTSSPLAVCLGNSVLLADSATLINPPSMNNTITNFSWDFQNDGVLDSITLGVQLTGPPIQRVKSAFSYFYTAPGNYEIVSTVTTSSGCTRSDTIDVTIYDLPVAGFTTGNECFLTPVSFQDTSIITSPEIIDIYDWTLTNPLDPTFNESFSDTSFTYIFPQPGTYYIQLYVESENGCVDSIADSVVVYPNPVADFTYITDCFQTNHFQQTASPAQGLTYIWDMDMDGAPDTTLPVFTYVFPDSSDQNVNLQVYDINACTSDTTILVDVKGGVDNPVMPNVLSMSSTNGNEKFDFTMFAPGFNECISYTLAIFNRWGTLVYEAINDVNDPDMTCTRCFKGMNTNGVALTEGTYFYILKGDTGIEGKGTITIFN